MNDRVKAKQYLIDMRDDNYDCDAELAEIIIDNKLNSTSENATWSEVFEWRKAMICGLSLMLIQVFTGAVAVLFYSSTIFAYAGFDDAILGTVIVGAVMFIVTIFSADGVDAYGRKAIIVYGTILMFIAQMVMGPVLWFGESLGSSTQGIIAVICALVFIFGWSAGLGAAAFVGKYIIFNYNFNYNLINNMKSIYIIK